jgi:hypothetical protein
MTATVRAKAGTAFDLTIATSPPVVGKIAQLTALYGIDGVDIAKDALGAALTLPATMTEGSDGIYYVAIQAPASGVYWAKFTVDGHAHDPVIIRTYVADPPAYDALVGTSWTAAVVADTNPASVTLTVTDEAGVLAGKDGSGVAITWPVALVQVSGHTDSWYYQDVIFSEAMRAQAVVTPAGGAIFTDVFVVFQAASAVSSQFQGWHPDAAYSPDDWLSIAQVRKHTGWTTSQIADQDLRDLRALCIDMFMEHTNVWGPRWDGTFYSIDPQGYRAYLPVPVILESRGGIAPVVKTIKKWGSQDEIQTIAAADIMWRVDGRDSKQPYIELRSGPWDNTYDIKIYASWGFDTAANLSYKFKQVLIGLMRWQSLSFGMGFDGALEQATATKELSVGTRDSRATFDSSVIGNGLTGNRIVDRMLAELMIHRPPRGNRR